MSEAFGITFVSSHAHLGGEEGYLLTLLDELGPAWIQEVVVLEDGPLVPRLRAAGHPVAIVPTSRRAGIASSAWKLRRRFAATGPRLVHANGVKAALVCALAGAPLLWLKHDFSWDGPLARFVGRRARLVVGVSRAVTETFDGSRARTAVVHSSIREPAVDRETARRKLLDALGAPDAGFIAAIAARVDPAKGHREAVAVVPAVRERAPGFRLAILGAEHAPHLEYAASLRAEVAELGVADAVAFLGYRDDAVELIAGADALLIPTVVDERGFGREGFSLTALEAMAVGTPVVGYRHGALPDVVGDCGLLVSPGDRDALRAAILRLMDDRDLSARLAECGRERFAASFSLPRFVAEIKERYREAANAGDDGQRR